MCFRLCAPRVSLSVFVLCLVYDGSNHGRSYISRSFSEFFFSPGARKNMCIDVDTVGLHVTRTHTDTHARQIVDRSVCA